MQFREANRDSPRHRTTGAVSLIPVAQNDIFAAHVQVERCEGADGVALPYPGMQVIVRGLPRFVRLHGTI